MSSTANGIEAKKICYQLLNEMLMNVFAGRRQDGKDPCPNCPTYRRCYPRKVNPRNKVIIRLKKEKLRDFCKTLSRMRSQSNENHSKCII